MYQTFCNQEPECVLKTRFRGGFRVSELRHFPGEGRFYEDLYNDMTVPCSWSNLQLKQRMNEIFIDNTKQNRTC